MKPKPSVFIPFMILLASLAGLIRADVCTHAASFRDSKYLKKYFKNKKVCQLLCVEYRGHSDAAVRYYQKGEDGRWKRIFSCRGYVGKKGMGKKKEGDRKTPIGIFTPNLAFGIRKDPGSLLPYTKVTSRHYWSGEKKNYNRLIVQKKMHRIRGEHLADYKGTYNYVIDIGYNRRCIFKKGSAIFLHCFGKNKYTAGCVAVPEERMKTLVQTMDKHSKICIF